MAAFVGRGACELPNNSSTVQLDTLNSPAVGGLIPVKITGNTYINNTMLEHT
jgi:hypothetical protein